jgi:hypothetical protein
MVISYNCIQTPARSRVMDGSFSIKSQNSSGSSVLSKLDLPTSGRLYLVANPELPLCISVKSGNQQKSHCIKIDKELSPK